jgi:hypothetical protein
MDRGKGKIVVVFNKAVQCEDVWESGCVAVRIINRDVKLE